MFFREIIAVYSKDNTDNMNKMCHQNAEFLGALAELRKTTISFVMPVRPSVRMEQLDSHWKDFYDIWYLKIIRKSVEKIHVLLKSDTNNVYFTLRPIYIFSSYLAEFFLEREIFTQKL